MRAGLTLLPWVLGLLGTGAPGAPAQTAPPLELVESVPIETTLDSPDLADAHEVWVEMIEKARRRIDLAHFYASNHPGSRLETVVRALEAAAARGVAVRFLTEKNFYETYPETIDRLAAVDGIETRLYPVRDVMGGVLHAKMMLVDDEGFVGSQNFDWRALEHIQELGLRVRMPRVVAALDAVFRLDWALATGEEPEPGSALDPVRVAETWAGEPLEVIPVASPRDFLPSAVEWDLPHLLRLIDGARSSVRVQLLSYGTVSRDGSYFAELDTALRRAAARGVTVQLLLADWSKRSGSIEALQSLQCIPRIEVKLATIPEWSGGFLPYSRVVHAKYLVVDGARFWLGTSNWSRSYFFDSRNVGLVVEHRALAERLDAYFTDGFRSTYAVTVDPAGTYTPPRRSR